MWVCAHLHLAAWLQQDDMVPAVQWLPWTIPTRYLLRGSLDAGGQTFFDPATGQTVDGRSPQRLPHLAMLLPLPGVRTHGGRLAVRGATFLSSVFNIRGDDKWLMLLIGPGFVLVLRLQNLFLMRRHLPGQARCCNHRQRAVSGRLCLCRHPRAHEPIEHTVVCRPSMLAWIATPWRLIPPASRKTHASGNCRFD